MVDWPGYDWLTFEEVGDVLQLRDVVLPVAAVVDEEREDVVELPTGVRRVQLRQLPEDGAPTHGRKTSELPSLPRSKL